MEQLFPQISGFYDSVNQDRLYSADDMNRPYRRLVSNGVFANQDGTPSDDLKVIANGTMNITVNSGEGIFAYKWFSSETQIISVPSNNTANPRIDSVIVQVDTRVAARVANLVYRTGTPSATPTPPALSLETGVTEYRIANVYITAGANAITNANITDLRGSSSCPWVQALIQQPDTSTMWTQWETAYQDYYNESTSNFESYEAARQSEWDQFFENLTQDLTLSTNVVKIENSYTTTATVTEVPVGIASYDKDRDILLVFINGVYADPTKYTYVSSGNKISLTSSLTAGQDVYFIVLKSIITGDMSTAETMVQNIEDALDVITTDSGWINLTLENSATAFNGSSTPGVRCIGDRVYLRGAFKGVTVNGTTIATLPVSYRPTMNHVYTSCAVSSAQTVNTTVTITIQTDGLVKLSASSGALSSSDMISLATHYVLG